MSSRVPTALLVAGGAAIGAGLHWGLAETIESGWLPWHTLISNLVGSALLGYLLGRTRHTEPPAWATAGFAGGLTTMSGLAVELAVMLDVALYGRAVAYLLVTLVLGIGSYRLAAQ